MSHVLANLHRMVIKPTFRHGSGEAVFGEKLNQEQLAALREKILASPRNYVGQEELTLSTAPVLLGQRVEPRHMALRVHLVATTDAGGKHSSGGTPSDGYIVMPGGLARFSA